MEAAPGEGRLIDGSVNHAQYVGVDLAECPPLRDYVFSDSLNMFTNRFGAMRR